jgi:hypothetical protein
LFINNWDFYEDAWTPIDRAGIPAQGNDDPQSVFYEHAVVAVGNVDADGTVFDPSYGATYTNYVGWETAALASIGMVYSPPESYWAGIANESETLETDQNE